MKNKMPFCPNCKCSIFVGKVRSYDIAKSKSMSAYFCSNCLTEFSKNHRILLPYWGEISTIESLTPQN